MASIWVHLAAVLALGFLPEPTPQAEQDEPSTPPLTLIQLPPPEPTPQPETEPGETPSTLGERAEAALVQATTGLRRAEEALAELRDDAPLTAREGLEQRVELLAATVDAGEALAAALETPSPASSALQQLAAQLEQLRREARALDPLVDAQQVEPLAVGSTTELAAVARQAAEAEAASAVAQDDSRPAPSEEAPPPEVRPPEPEAEPAAEDPTQQRFVRRRQTDEDVELLDDAAYISSASADAERTTRSRVTSATSGAATPQNGGTQTTPSPQQQKAETGEDETAPGAPQLSGSADDASEQVTGGGLAGEGDSSGRRGEQSESEAPGAARAASSAQRDGQPGAPLTPSLASQAAVASSAGTTSVGAEGIASADALFGQFAADGASDSGSWRPIAARILSAPTPPPTPAAEPEVAPEEAPPTPTESDGVAEVERPQDDTSTGGDSPEAEGDELAAEGEDPTIEPGETTDEQAGDVDTPIEVVDPIADLRADLGWGGIDRTRLRPRARVSGQAGTPGATATSQQQSLSPDVDVSRVSYIQAQGTEIGVYTESLYEVVQAAWYDLDLSGEDKAQGIQGAVTLIFRVQRNGRVTDLSILRSSGHGVLDVLAMQAIPERLPRIPREIEQDQLLQEITFHYHNPLVQAPPPSATNPDAPDRP